VPTYTYRCGPCGVPFDVIAPMSASRDDRRCPACDAPAQRIVTVPGVRRTPTAVREALEAGERSREAPTVTTSVPPSTHRDRRPTPVSRDPRHARLPRP
jgi:putative FmdB family regulatory protein